MIIERTKASVTTICGTFVFPGVNIISNEDAPRFLADPSFKANVEAGTIKIIDKHHEATETNPGLPKPTTATPAPAPEPTGPTVVDQTKILDKAAQLAKMTVDACVKVIKKMYLAPELDAILKLEKRKKVQIAIQKQLDIVREKEGTDQE
jgi:hypothetical protein